MGKTLDWESYFSSIGEPASVQRIFQIEEALGVELPEAYKSLIHSVGGGRLRHENSFIGGDFGPGWPKGISVDLIFGNGILDDGDDISLDSPTGSTYLIKEWNYPNIGVVFGMTEAAGEDVLLLNFSDRRFPIGSIVFSDEFGTITPISESIQEFFALLSREKES